MTAERSPSAGSNPSPEHYHSSHHPSWLEQRSWASTVEISTTLLIRSHGYIPICWEAFSAVLVHVVLVPKSLFKLIIFPGIKWILSACQTAYPRILAMSGNSRDNLSTDKHQSSTILTLILSEKNTLQLCWQFVLDDISKKTSHPHVEFNITTLKSYWE